MSMQLQAADNLLPAGWDAPTPPTLTSSEVGAVSAVAREEAELKGAIFVAKSFPRDETAAFQKIVRSCQRPALAEAATYSFPRGGQTVSGPSVQLAREMARCWGNIRYGLRIVSADAETVHIRGYALDLETNAYIEAEDKFNKKIQRKGRWVEPDERDLRELVNRRGAILVRNCILQVLPPDVIEEALLRARSTLEAAARGQLSQNREDAIRRLVIAFDALSVTQAMIEQYIGHPINLLTAEELADLRAVFKSISDGNTRREEHFTVPGAANGNGGGKAAELNEMLQQKKQPAKEDHAELDAVGLTGDVPEAKEEAPAPPPAPADPFFAFLQAVEQTRPEGGDAGKAVRTRLAKLGAELLADDSEAHAMVVALVDAKALGKDQGEYLIELAEAALSAEADGEGDPTDLFE